MITMEQARERVARGAAYLDQFMPGWQDKIDMGTLTLSSCHSCIVGQLGGRFFDIEAIGLRTGWTCKRAGEPSDAITYGFDLKHEEIATALDAQTRRASYQPLQDAWTEAIADRKVAKEAPKEVLVMA